MTIVDSPSVRKNRVAEAWRVVSRVSDPELDEPVTEMGFVERIEIANDWSVALDFRLPTYWCSPNFAFLMLDGIRKALESLSWAPRYRITLHDHLFADEINRGVSEGKRFEEIFEALAPSEDLAFLREKFLRKAFQKRQEAALLGLREAGWADVDVLALTTRGMLETAKVEPRVTLPLTRYLEAMRERFPLGSNGDSAFQTWEGVPLLPAELPEYLSRLRAIRINMEFNGALCRGLKAARYQTKLSNPGVADWGDGSCEDRGRPSASV
jgi:metal-sulfur cluster biosynthetic enzyme